MRSGKRCFDLDAEKEENIKMFIKQQLFRFHKLPTQCH